jgi:UPF0271 protein
MRKVDLNADMGESFGMYKLGHDEEFMEFITSANVACGFHAGDPSVMKNTVKLAKKYNVQVGAHPGLPDLQGFGRREMKLTPAEVYDMVVYQVGALKAFAETAGLHIMKKGIIAPMADSMDLKTVYELYSDLGYDAEGNLVITRAHDAHDPDPVARRVRRMVIDHKVTAMDGTEITIEGNSVCVHCDTPGAFDIVKAVRAALEQAGCELASPEM